MEDPSDPSKGEESKSTSIPTTTSPTSLNYSSGDLAFNRRNSNRQRSISLSESSRPPIIDSPNDNTGSGISGNVVNTLWAGANAVGNYIWSFWGGAGNNNNTTIANKEDDETKGPRFTNSSATTKTTTTTTSASASSMTITHRAMSVGETSSTTCKNFMDISTSRGGGPYLEEVDPGIKLVGRTVTDTNEQLLTQSMIDRIHAALPPRFRLCNTWILLYGSPEHGYSLNTLFLRCRDHDGPILTIVRDVGNHIFGVFGTETWRPHFGHFGTGESFLWRVEKDGRIHRYSSTGRNAYYLLGETSYIAAGCGEGKFGFWLDAELLWGMSERVSTYDNDCLASNERFKCCVVEVWGLDMSQSSP